MPEKSTILDPHAPIADFWTQPTDYRRVYSEIFGVPYEQSPGLDPNYVAMRNAMIEAAMKEK